MNAKRFDYYFMKRNGLWVERLKEYEELGSGGCSSIAKLIHACEIGDGIDQHASEDLKAVSSVIATQAEEITSLKKIEQVAGQTALALKFFKHTIVEQDMIVPHWVNNFIQALDSALEKEARQA